MTKKFEGFTYEVEKYFHNAGESHVLTFQFGYNNFEDAKRWGKDELKEFTNDEVTLRVYDDKGVILYEENQNNYYQDTVITINGEKVNSLPIEFKDNSSEVEYKNARIVIETLSVVDENDNIYIFDMASSSLSDVEKFVSDGCPCDKAEEYGVYLQV